MKFWLAAAQAMMLIGSPGLAGDAITFGPPPRLAITSEEFASQQKSPEFPKIKAAKLSAGDALVAAPVLIPDREGDWIFYYACPADGTTLKPVGDPRGREVPHDHQCPRCQKVYNDARTVAALTLT